MEISFNFHEALLGLTAVVSMADGEAQKSELDARVQMIISEGMPDEIVNSFKRKYTAANSAEEVFKAALEALKRAAREEQIKGCAWMYQVALIAKNGIDGDLDYVEDKW